jgi:N-methylhydantoinase A
MLRVGIDVGGTFTDLAAIDDANGEILRLKVPSTPHAPELAVIAALEEMLALGHATGEIAFFGHSTTIATNALLGQVGLELPRVALVATHGFRDVIEIGRQNRSAVYDLFVERPRPLVARDDRFTVVERIDAAGNVLVPLDDASVGRACREIAARGFDAVAVALLNSYANDAHERRVAEAIEAALPGVPVTRSAAVDPEYREYERSSTAVVNAALAPIVQRYLERLTQRLRERKIVATPYVMRSDGGMSSAQRIASSPAAIVESGPASGVIAAASLASSNDARLLAFDMGGTTAKAGTIVGGSVQLATEFEAAGKSHSGRAIKGSGYPVRFPFVDLAEVSAGGGTMAWIDDAGSLRVGPLSAGADPGPACYGRADTATVTDANVVLGRLHQKHLLGGTFPIDAARSRAAVETLAKPLGLSVEATAAGIVTLIDAEMAKVLRIVTVERGEDPRDFMLVAYGGGGPLHACSLALELGIGHVLVPDHPGIFSAQGLLVADVAAHYVKPLLCDAGSASLDQLEATFAALESSGRSELLEQGVDAATMSFRRTYDARYAGQSFELMILHGGSLEEIASRFHQAHRAHYGYHVPGERIELVNARLHASGKLQHRHPERSARAQRTSKVEGQVQQVQRRVWIDERYVNVPVYQRDALQPGMTIEGPAIVEQYDTTTYVAPRWRCEAGETLAMVRG